MSIKINPTQFDTTPRELNSSQYPRAASTLVTAPEPVSSALSHAQQALSEMPDVDMQRVMAIKAAINEGKISVNVDELAHAVWKFHQR